MKKLLIRLASLLLLYACAHNADVVPSYSLLPIPQEMQTSDGEFTLTDETKLYIDAPTDDKSAIAKVFTAWNTQLATVETDAATDCIAMEVCDKVENITSPEGYTINVTKDRIDVKATSGAGLFYAAQTLQQLADGGNTIPICTITDEPQFAYRGLMLDVSRHFFGKEFVKKQIDVLAQYKMNRLHLHLTDAAGWRIEIKKYPRLTEFAAWRKPAIWKDWWFGDRKYVEEGSEGAYGGYYTQEDIKELVAYAAERYITIIPEIEMPAHSEEVLTAYPELSCTHEPYKQADFCVGNEKTFEFLENVLSEVLELFPSEYIHIGGDEAGKASWPHCPLCQKRMKREKLKDVNELQSYLIQRIEKFVNSKGRQIIGWDEILDGGLAPNATVMSWRGTEGGIAAAESGHKAIMTPGGYCYLDSYQDAPHTQPMAFGPYMPLEKVYSYDPRAEIDSTKAHLIHGIQGNLWAEYIPTEELVEYMIYPRLLAIAEIGWSNPAKRDYAAFKERATKATNHLRSNGYNAFDLANEFGQRKEAQAPVEHFAINGNISYAEGAPYSGNYKAGGDRALIDGVCGGWTYTDKKWQGFIKDGVDVTIDLGEEKDITEVTAQFMQMCIPDVWFPAEVIISTSCDGNKFSELARIEHTVVRDEGLSFKEYGWKGNTKSRYINYRAKCGPQRGWLFTDEIIVK